MIRVIFFFLFTVVLSNPGYAQQTISLKGIKGEYILAPNAEISLKEAFERAVSNAKQEALRKAGIAENVSASDVLITSQNNAEFKQDLNSFVAVEINGAVLNDSVVERRDFVDQFGNMVVQVFLNTDVIKYEKKPDPSFDFKVEGLREYYENNDLVNFDFFPYANGYLKIFNINDTECFMVYPYSSPDYSFLSDTINRKFIANRKLRFPLNKNIGDSSTGQTGYMMTTRTKRERNYLIFVYTKENILFKDTPEKKNILNWIYRITPDKRKVRFYDFVIVNKQSDNE